MLANHPFERSPNPRMSRACARCARVPEAHPDYGRQRDPADERDIARLAARAAEVPPAVGDSLWRYANSRAYPGPVRPGMDWREEARQELGDGFNYLAWWAQEAGVEERAVALHALSAVVVAWQRLHAR